MISLLKPIFELPLFGVFLTIGCYILSHYIAKKVDKPYVTTLLLTITMVIAFLVVTGIELEDYQKGGHMISFLVAPMTLALAVPMYNRRHIIVKHLFPLSAPSSWAVPPPFSPATSWGSWWAWT